MKHEAKKEPRKKSEKQIALEFDIKRERRICSSCKTEKPFRFSHFGSDGKKLYYDGLSRLWIGSRCSECGPNARPNKGTGRWPLQEKE